VSEDLRNILGVTAIVAISTPLSLLEARRLFRAGNHRQIPYYLFAATAGLLMMVWFWTLYITGIDLWDYVGLPRARPE
jgi:zinc transporter ZupT